MSADCYWGTDCRHPTACTTCDRLNYCNDECPHEAKGQHLQTSSIWETTATMHPNPSAATTAATTLLMMSRSQPPPVSIFEDESDKENEVPPPRQIQSPGLPPRSLNRKPSLLRTITPPRYQRQPLKQLRTSPSVPTLPQTPLQVPQQMHLPTFLPPSASPSDVWTRMGSPPDLFDVTPDDYYSRLPRPATAGLINHLLTICKSWEPNSDLAVSFTKMERLITTATLTSSEITNLRDPTISASVLSATQSVGPALAQAISIFLSFGRLLTTFGTISTKTDQSVYSLTPPMAARLLLPLKITAEQKGSIASMRAHETNFLRVFRKLILGHLLNPSAMLSLQGNICIQTPPLPNSSQSKVSFFDGNPSQQQRSGYWQAYQEERTGLDASPAPSASTRTMSAGPGPESPRNL